MDSETTIRPPRYAPGVRLGNLAILLLIAQAVTGLALMFHYRPTTTTAYFDLIDLAEVSRLGFVRGLHFWGSHAVVIVACLHLFRRALRGTQGPRRRRAWYFALALAILTVLLATTGSLLPWDQEAFWGLAQIAPDPTPDPAADSNERLLRFYVLHCLVLPLLVTGLILTRRRWKPTKL